MLRLDLFFSVWIYIWFLAYYLGFTNFNPSFALICAFIFVVVSSTIYMCEIHPDNLIIFLIINILPKVAALLELSFRNAIDISIADVLLSTLLFILYILYLYVNKTNIVDFYKGQLEMFK